MKQLYIASCVAGGGIYRYRLENDRLSLLDKTPCDRPMYMAREGDTLYVLLRAPFERSEESGVITYRIREDGSLTDPTPPVSTAGTVGCHIAVSDGDIYVANYVSGSVSRLGGACDKHEGKGKDPKRQDAPHAHSVTLSPSGKYLLSADLGLDRIYVYDRALRLVSTVEAEAGSGPRHMVFSRDGKYLYVLNELASTVTSYLWKEGLLERLESVSTLNEENERNPSIAAAIRLSSDGALLYATNRGENTVAVFSVKDERLTKLASYPTEGDEPRDFALLADEEYAIVTNQFSDCILLYRHENGRLTPLASLPIKAPLAVMEL